MAFVDDTLNLSTCPVSCVQTNAVAEYVQYRKNFRFNEKEYWVINLASKSDIQSLKLNGVPIDNVPETSYLSEIISKDFMKATIEKRLKSALGSIACLY